MISQFWANYLISIFTEGAIFGIAALGLNIVWGWAGDFDLAYYGYVALGAYMTIVLSIGTPIPPAQFILGWTLPYPLAVLGAVVAASLMGLVVGLIALRNLRGLYFSIVTLGAVYVLYVFAGQYVPLFDGYNGVSGLVNPMADIFNISFNAYPTFFLFLCLAVFALIYVLLGRISASRLGLVFRSLREDERAAAAFGRDIYRLKLRAYVLGAAVAGLSGGLLAGYLSAFNPSAWSPLEVIVLYSAILVGGKGNIRGVVLGVVVIFLIVQESTRFLPDVPGHPEIIPSLRLITIGLVLVLFLFFRKQGLIPESRLHFHLPREQGAPEANGVVAVAAGQGQMPVAQPVDGSARPAAEASVTGVTQPVTPAAEQPATKPVVVAAARRTPSAVGPAATDMLVVDALSKHFGGLAAVDRCSFQVPREQVTGLIGPNGAGKSTVIDLISGFKFPDSGTVTFDGTNISGLPPHRIARLGLIRTFQTPREWPALTVLENILLARFEPRQETLRHSVVGAGLGRHNVDAEDLSQAHAILEEFGLTALGNERAGNLSGGQKRLVEFARIRMAEPKLIILDEPMGGVNPVLGERMAQAIEGFVSMGTTVIVVEHNLPFIERVSNQVVVMAQGSVITAGTFESLRSNQSVVDAYLGDQLEAER